ncbi:hypothetical protein LMA00_06530 [Burkholderia ambifaria]|uniref:hypothetical protein n=1 Tax=Burkholderia ambifaria TaxID=152480 RepID=UPI00158AF358|nr:hypothetical protein [Burkholderia ambifaria]UEP49404.1 hypothetical protein LMA00_06530 [Burkholderia ambifaria]
MVVIVAERPRRVKLHAAGAAPGNLAFLTETRDNPLARSQQDPFELQTGARATADYHAADRRLRRDVRRRIVRLSRPCDRQPRI